MTGSPVPHGQRAMPSAPTTAPTPLTMAASSRTAPTGRLSPGRPPDPGPCDRASRERPVGVVATQHPVDADEGLPGAGGVAADHREEVVGPECPQARVGARDDGGRACAPP